MPDVLIKSDIHTSEAEKLRFEELREEYGSALQEKRPEDAGKPSGLGARIVQSCWDNYAGKVADFIQRDSADDPGIDSLDLSLAEMYSSLGPVKKFLVYGFSVFWVLGGFLSLLISLVRPFFLLWGLTFFLMLPVVHVISVVLFSTGARERRMAEVTEEELEKEGVGDVVIFVGAAHAVPVKKRLEERGIDAEVEGVKGFSRVVVVPVNFLRKGLWRLKQFFSRFTAFRAVYA